MPSSYTTSARFVLQATGENNNTWGVILNQGAFQLIDDNVNGRWSQPVNGSYTLSTVQGATDEARMAFLDVSGGTGGQIVIPPVPKAYFVHNAAAGPVSLIAQNALVAGATFGPGDAGPAFSDGATSYSVMIAGQPVRAYVDGGDAALKTYIDAAVTDGLSGLPPALGQDGKVLIVREPGSPPAEAWTADFLQTTDVQGLQASLNAAADLAMAYALLF
jgi:hypothetical protein